MNVIPGLATAQSEASAVQFEIQLKSVQETITQLQAQRDALLAAAKAYVSWSEGEGQERNGAELFDALRQAIADCEKA